MKKVVIIGCGKVGLTYAYSLINTPMDLDEIVLIDIDKEKLKGDYLDLSQSICFSENDLDIKIGDYSDVEDANVICITAGISQDTNSTRLEDIKESKKIFKDITDNLKKYKFDGIYVIASNPNDVMCYSIYKYLGYNPNKILGSGVSLDTARFIDIIENKGHKTDGFVLGEHGDSSFIPWSNFTVDDNDPNEIFNEQEQEEILKEVHNASKEIIKRKKATYYGVATCLTKITKCVIDNEKYIMPLSCYDKEHDVFIGNIASINKHGLVEKIKLDFSKQEQEAYNESIQILQEYNEKL